MTTQPHTAHATRFVTANLFIGVGAVAIVGGGLLSAMLARHPSEFAMWASAYLVLVVGAAQVIFGLCLRKMSRPSANASVWAAWISYNVANGCVLAGTLYKGSISGHILAYVGGIGILFALICMLHSVRGAKQSIELKVFYIAVVVLLVSTPLGLWLGR